MGCSCPVTHSMNGALAFVDTSDCTVMNIAEHYMASDVEWDPTGRYVVTSVSWWSHKVQDGRCWAPREGNLSRVVTETVFCGIVVSRDPRVRALFTNLCGLGSRNPSFSRDSLLRGQLPQSIGHVCLAGPAGAWATVCPEGRLLPLFTVGRQLSQSMHIKPGSSEGCS